MEAVNEPGGGAGLEDPCDSSLAVCVGFKYLRMAADGSSSNVGGMRSSVKGTFGSKANMDRVRKSSAGTEGMFMAEKERAAFRSARRLAVKLDLKADLKGPNILAVVFSSSSGEASKAGSDKSSKSALSRESGSSSCLPGGDDTGVRVLLVGRTLRPRDALYGVSRGDRESVEKESVREGTDSHDTAREVDKGDAIVLSPIDKLSSSKSSGGLSSTSRGPLMKLRLSSFSEV